MSYKRFLTTFTLQLGLIFFLIGIILTIVGIYGVFIYDPDFDPDSENAPPEFAVNLMDSIGDWKYWCMLIGPILIIAGGWYFFDNISKRKEFKELMETTSKHKFIRNLDRVEFLAWRLTPEHQRLLMKKKRKFNIK